MPVIPAPPPERDSAPILDTLAAGISRRLWGSVEDVFTDGFSRRELLEMLRDVRRRPADGVLLALARRLLEGLMREPIRRIVRETLVDELPGALAALGLLSDDECTIDEGGAE